jgi:hypothetical protein
MTGMRPKAGGNVATGSFSARKGHISRRCRRFAPGAAKKSISQRVAASIHRGRGIFGKRHCEWLFNPAIRNLLFSQNTHQRGTRQPPIGNAFVQETGRNFWPEMEGEKQFFSLGCGGATDSRRPRKWGRQF